jgi:hypothetical protein
LRPHRHIGLKLKKSQGRKELPRLLSGKAKKGVILSFFLVFVVTMW